ncbi:MAG TPA: hypothetical protein VEK57_18405 [Thermoanaerobaculia bacterium]|nr:hypothetical protein [Thermoanaerobaculia bacterium]
MEFDQVLSRFAEFFEREGIRYALAGGNALVALGHQRPTHDVDFVVDGKCRSRVIKFAESHGYETAFVSEGFSNHYHPDEAFGHVDFLYVYGSTADALFDAAHRRSTFGVELPVLAPEHLIAMKVRAMKQSPMRVLIDAPDIAYLLSLPGLDRTRVREYFSQHGLLKIFDELEKDLR